MKLNSKNILKQIAVQRDCIMQFLVVHGRNVLFNKQLEGLCPKGREKTIVELALFNDCLTAIEAVFFSLNGSTQSQFDELQVFLKTAAKLFRKKDRKLYEQFSQLDQTDCERLLEIHYTDKGWFGGANRRTQWSGFDLSKRLSELVGDSNPLNNYKQIFESVVVPLLEEDEGIDDVLELGGVWTALRNETNSERHERKNVSTGAPASKRTSSLQSADLNNSAMLFEVVSNNSAEPIVKLNQQHGAFQNGHTFEILLQAWARMENDAWDQRKQLLEDIRTDWGRVARDISQLEGANSQ